MTRVVAGRDGVRVDRLIADDVGLAMAVVRRLCDEGRVRRDGGGRVAAGDRLRAGDALIVDDGAWLAPVAAPLTVLSEDDDVVVVDKPAGLACHPLNPGEADSVAHRVVARFPEVATASPDPREGGLIHRLDTGTSGCLAFARSRDAWQRLRRSIDDAEKDYLAIVVGDPGPFDGARLEDVIVHDATDRRRMQTAPPPAPGRPGQTDVAVIGQGLLGDLTVGLVRLRLHGGRRHQLRVQLASRGHPLVGDALYGGQTPDGVVTPLLHAWTLRLPGRPVVAAPLPPPFMAVLVGAGIAPPG